MNRGILYAVLAYLTWGMLPLYWKLFTAMSAWEILAHRIVWSFVFVGIVLSVTKSWRKMLASMEGKRQRLALLFCSLFITSNWLIYIWAVNAGHVLETSLGYYMNPLLSVLFGVLFLKERLHAGQWAAIALATVGVSLITIQYGAVPWMSILLALTFALYGMAKKLVKADAMISLAWETAMVFPAALIYLMVLHLRHADTIAAFSAGKLLLLAMSGAVTAIPLYWFALAAKRLPLSIFGFIQYISPTTSLMLAIFVFHESFTAQDLMHFGFIWSALVVFTLSTMGKTLSEKKRAKQAIVAREAVK